MALFSKDPAPSNPTPRPEPRTSQAQGPAGVTYIGVNLAIDGTISGSEMLTVDGTVRGKIELTHDLRIGVKARLEASIHARNVMVEGRVNGDISADDRVELVASASVEGNIKAPKIVVAEGAKFRGSVDMGSKVPRDDAAPSNAN